MRKNGLSSNAWGVYVDNSGEVYIACRDSAREVKVSLHKSGQQHIAFTKESGIRTMEGNRFWNQWTEPHHSSSSPLIPSFKLVFPSWTLGLTYDDRKSNSKIWDKNQIIVESSDSPFVTQVSFFMMDEHLTMSSIEVPSYPLGVIPARPGKKLWIIAHHGPEGNLREVVTDTINHIDRTVGKKLFHEHAGTVLTASMAGAHDDGYPYMLTALLEVHSSAT